MQSPQAKKLFCTIFLSIFVICCGAQTTKTEIIPPSTQSPLTDEKTVLQEDLIQILGVDSKNMPRLTKIAYSTPENGDITIKWSLQKYSTPALTEDNAKIDTVNILKTLKKNKTRFIYVILIGTFPPSTEADSSIEREILNLGFNKSRLDKVNWDEFPSSEIFKFSDVAVIADDWR
ncbi:MAG: hypothetical protein U0V18_15785 [Anaerolineales bacterium]